MLSAHHKSRGFESSAAYKQKMQKQLQELLTKRAEISKEDDELSKPMDIRLNEWIIDFMNLVFGMGEESTAFWDELLLPEASVHYSFSLAELYKWEKNFNALYFALCEQLNLKVTERPSSEGTPTNDASASKGAKLAMAGSGQFSANRPGYSQYGG